MIDSEDRTAKDGVRKQTIQENSKVGYSGMNVGEI